MIIKACRQHELLWLSRPLSLSAIALGKWSRWPPVSTKRWLYAFAGRPTLVFSYVGVHKGTSLMISSLLPQQCPAFLDYLSWIVRLMGVSGHAASALSVTASWICSPQHPLSLSNYHLAFFFLTRRFGKVQMVQSYCSTDTAAVWKNSQFILSESSNFQKWLKINPGVIVDVYDIKICSLVPD